MDTEERKIGEIFEYKGEWYQCVEQPKKYDKTVCAICAFQGNGNCEFDRCSETYRSDKKSVIFKKLEKVGEQFLYKGKQMQSYIRATDELCNWNNNLLLLEHVDSDIIDIEIKQKEDMEEKKVKLDKLVTDYTSNKIAYNEFEKTVKELYANKEESKPTLKSFDLEAAKAGKPVCTRDGRRARIICFDSNGGRPIVALVTECDDEEEIPYKYHCDGSYNCQSIPSDNDLMMLPEKKGGWVNVYKNQIHDTPKSAEEAHKGITDYIKTIRVEWEE